MSDETNQATAHTLWVGRIVPDSEPPQRREWRSAGEWAIFKFPSGREVEVHTDENERLYFVTRSVDGTLPGRILFNGASNQVWLEFKD